MNVIALLLLLLLLLSDPFSTYYPMSGRLRCLSAPACGSYGSVSNLSTNYLPLPSNRQPM